MPEIVVRCGLGGIAKLGKAGQTPPINGIAWLALAGDYPRARDRQQVLPIPDIFKHLANTLDGVIPCQL